jgi:hypothetical protein
VAESAQSKRTAPPRDAARTSNPAACAASTTLRPVLPEAPVTNSVLFRVFSVMKSSELPSAEREHR